MLNRSKVVVVLVAVLAVVPIAFAQDAAAPAPAAVVPADQQPSDAQLDRLFDAMGISEQLRSADVVTKLVNRQSQEELQQFEADHPEFEHMSPEQRQKASEVIGKYMLQAGKLYSPQDMIAGMKDVYRRHLTGKDVENIIAFYNSESGQRMVKMAPLVMEEFLPKAMEKLQANMRPLMVQMSKELAAIMQSGAGGKTEQK